MLTLNLNSLPTNFDWQYYIDSHYDLQNAGISTEKQAIAHYLLYGHKEDRIYAKSKLNNHLSVLDISEDFDHRFYLSEYPDVGSYCKHMSNTTQEQRLYHHYINFGKKEGRFKNKYDKNHFFININASISNLIRIEELICPTNNLECVCLLTTIKEIHNNKYQNFIKHLIKKTKDSSVSKIIDFKIILNQKPSKSLSIDSLQNIFSDVEILTLNIPIEDDVYLSELKDGQKLPVYGLKSGPNLTFLQTMDKMQQYDTCLFLETDCLLGANWLDRFCNYVKYANGFLVSGATYDGSVFTKAGSAMMNHINGGTALYSTSNPVLMKLLQILSNFLQTQIAHSMPGLAYDYALKLLIDTGINNSYENESDRLIWQFINRHYLPCKLMINCSTPPDSNINTNILQDKYNPAILHKK